MRILGIFLQAGGSLAPNVNIRLSKTLQKLGGIVASLLNVGCLHDVGVGLLMLHTELLPVLLFGVELWGHHQLVRFNPMQHRLQRVVSVYLRKILQLPSSTGHWITTLVMGQLPVQALIVRSFVRFLNHLYTIARYNTVIDQCLQIQVHLALQDQPCWLSSWATAFGTTVGVLRSFLFTSCQDRLPCHEKLIITALLDKYSAQLNAMGSPADVACLHRRTAFVWQNVVTCQLHTRPPGVGWDLPRDVARSWHLFLAGGAPFPVHAAQHQPYVLRLCSFCTLQAVGDEHHVVLDCPALAHVRDAFRRRLGFAPVTLVCFLYDNQCSGALPHYLHALCRYFC